MSSTQNFVIAIATAALAVVLGYQYMQIHADDGVINKGVSDFEFLSYVSGIGSILSIFVFLYNFILGVVKLMSKQRRICDYKD